MRFLIVTGMSGAGKTTALKMLEDFGYFCIDNLPISLMVPFVKLLNLPDSRIEYAAVGIDIRNGEFLSELETTLNQFKHEDFCYEILFLDCSTDILMQRYKETRRNHPLSGHGRIEDGISEERGRIAFLNKQADYMIDTSRLLTKELRSRLEGYFSFDNRGGSLSVTILSFGYKYGLPSDADLVFDVRFLPNPHYVSELRPKTGNEKVIQDYVLQNDTGQQFLQKLFDLTDFLIPNYIEEGKNVLVIAFGCTGGRHRSVTLANTLFQHLQGTESIRLHIEHRDVDKARSV